ncbi:MAG: M48 family metalloprotease [Acidobacteria bacterium]|nr:M48 family metalloprotease [Acidobacteriota bacterium]
MKYASVLIAVLALISLWRCQKDFVTGRSTFSLLSEADEVAMGRSSHDSVIAEYGTYQDDNLQSWLEQRGQKVAGVSHRSQLEYHFYVVDSPVVNAFALPGGYVYFTRGILAHFNSEAEMMGVLGHEVGHVVARHGAEQYSRVTMAQIGLGLASALSEEFRKYSMFAELGTTLLFLKFSRNQESESDRLGVQYATSLGYDGHKMADFFETIDRISASSGQSLPGFLSTHPNPANRRDTIHAMVRDMESQGFKPTIAATRDDYLKRINGMAFGDDPAFGYTEQGILYAPHWRLMFKPKSSVDVQKQRQAVQMSIAEGQAVVIFSVDDEHKTAEESMRAFAQKTQLNPGGATPADIGPIRASMLRGDVASQGANLSVVAYFFTHNNMVFQAYGFADKTQFASMEPEIQSALQSAQVLNDASALNRKSARLRVKSAPKTGTLRDNLAALHVAQQDMEMHALINAAQLEDRIERGYSLKVVVH